MLSDTIKEIVMSMVQGAVNQCENMLRKASDDQVKQFYINNTNKNFENVTLKEMKRRKLL